eukprot:g13024.t1
MSAAAGKGSMQAPPAGGGADARPMETPKDLKKRVRGLDKSLTSVHERLVQTERQIFDLERSYLEETRLYGNVLQGWDAYLDTKGKGSKEGKGGAGRGAKREASDDGEEGEGASKRTKGVELEERLFSLGSVTSPATKSLQKLEEAKRKAAAGGGGASGGAGAGVGPKTPREKRIYTKRTAKSAKKDSSSAAKKRKR